jgi:hypothetical protein
MSDPTEEYIYVWQVLDEDGRWGTIAAEIPGIAPPTPLVFRDRSLADHTRGVALRHGRGVNRTVRLARYAHAETIEQIEAQR